LNKIQKKRKLKVAFLISNISQWKFDTLYSYFDENPNTQVYVYLVANQTYADAHSEEIKHCIEYFEDKGTSREKIVYVNKSSEILNDDIDLIFLSRLPHHSNLFSLVAAARCLLIYLPYSYHVDKNDPLQVGKIQHVALWRHYVPNQYFKEASMRYNNGTAVVATGYPIFDYLADDTLLKSQKEHKSVWPMENKIKVIWAPHHSIEIGASWPYFSTFLLYYDYFLALANDPASQFTICFKPHPGLLQKLIDHPDWGLVRQREYYDAWVISKNGFLQDGIYNDLFEQSDCMVFDSVSFTAEYLYMGKPSCFLTREDKGDYTDYLNDVGKEFINYHKKASSKREVSEFLLSVKRAEYENINQPKILTGLSRDGTATKNIILDLENNLPILNM
jgi:hypothetical protein